MAVANLRSNIPGSFKGEIKRLKLLNQLKNTADVRLIALLAPSGYGKTTLLAQYARSLRSRAIWIGLNREDTDMHRFVLKVARALQDHDLFPHIELNLQHLHQWPLEHVRQLMVQHLGDARSNVKIMLDKTEWLTPESLQWLEGLIARLPEGHQVLLAGYASTQLMEALTNRPDVLILGAEALAFEKQEALSHFEARNEPWNEAIFQQTRGWPVGLRLNGSTAVDAVDWILALLHALPEPLQLALPQLIGEDEWHNALTLPDGSNLPDGWLDVILGSGLPLTHLQNNHFVPHTLLLEALGIVLARQPLLFKAIHHHYALKHAAAGKWLTAIDHHLQANEIQEALEVVEGLLPEFVQRGDLMAFRHILEQFQLTDLPFHLQAHMALSLIESSEAEKAHAILNHLSDCGHEDAVTSLVRASIFMKQGKYQQQLDWTERGLAMATDQISRVRLRRIRIAALNNLHRSEESLKECETYVQESLDTESPKHIIKAWIALANTQSDTGHYEQAVESYLKALQVVNQNQLDGQKGDLYYNLSLTLADLNRPLEGLDLLQEALNLPPKILGSWVPMLLGARGALLAQLGLNQQAIVSFQEASDLAPKYGLQHFALSYLFALADCAALDGQIQLARKTLGRIKIEFPDLNEEEQVYLQCSEALLAFQTGELQKAHAFEDIQDNPHLPHWTRCILPFFVAEIHLREGRLLKAQVDLAFQKLDDLGHDGPLESVLTHVQGLTQHCLQNHWHSERIQNLLVRQNSFPLDSTNWSLQLRGSGTFALTFQAQTVSLSLKKCEELLTFLTLHGASSRDTLIDALWDGQINTRIADHFRTLIRRLRSDLTRQLDLPMDPVPLSNGLYALHPQLEIHCDLQTFRNQSLAPEERLLAYQGDFMPAVKSRWATEIRSKLQEEFMALAEQHLQQLSPAALEHVLKCFPEPARLQQWLTNHPNRIVN